MLDVDSLEEANGRRYLVDQAPQVIYWYHKNTKGFNPKRNP